MGSQKLDKIIDSTELLVNTLLKHVHSCDHSCCVKDVLSGIYEHKNMHGPSRVHTQELNPSPALGVLDSDE